VNPSRARARLSAYLEDELPPRERARVEAALEGSTELRRELAELRRTVELLRGLPRPEAPPALAAAVMARVRAGEAEPTSLRNWLAGWLEPRYAIPIAAASLVLAVFLSPRFEAAVESPQQVASRSIEDPTEAWRRSVDVQALQQLREERLARRGRHHDVARILRGAGHPHSAAFASDIEVEVGPDFALVSADGR